MAGHIKPTVAQMMALSKMTGWVFSGSKLRQASKLKYVGVNRHQNGQEGKYHPLKLICRHNYILLFSS